MQMKSTHTKKNVHGQRENFAFGTQCNIYIPLSRVGGNTNFRICVGGKANFSVFRDWSLIMGRWGGGGKNGRGGGT